MHGVACCMEWHVAKWNVAWWHMVACCHVLTGFGIILASTWNSIAIVLRHGVAMLGDLKVRCQCKLDPKSVCELHPCKCPECRASMSEQKGLICKWRSSHVDYLAKVMQHVNVPNEIENITYCEALELSGKKAPMSPRERNLLNIMSYHVKGSMGSTFLILDKSQSICRTQMCPVHQQVFVMTS